MSDVGLEAKHELAFRLKCEGKSYREVGIAMTKVNGGVPVPESTAVRYVKKGREKFKAENDIGIEESLQTYRRVISEAANEWRNTKDGRLLNTIRQAQESIDKLLGLCAPVKTEVMGKGGGAIQIQQVTEEMMSRYEHAVNRIFKGYSSTTAESVPESDNDGMDSEQSD